MSLRSSAVNSKMALSIINENTVDKSIWSSKKVIVQPLAQRTCLVYLVTELLTHPSDISNVIGVVIVIYALIITGTQNLQIGMGYKN